MSAPRRGLSVPVLVVAVAAALFLVWVLWQQAGASTPGPATPATPSVTSTTPRTTPTTGRAAPTASERSGWPACAPADLPPEVGRAMDAVRAGGPFLRPRADGETFGNRERLLPSKPRSYYREYTVADPTSRFPGPRRLVTGGQRALGDEPEVWYYTADHYETYCVVS